MRDQAVSAHVMQSWVKRQKHIESSHFSPYTSRFFVGFVFGFSQYLFLPSACPRPPPSRHYLFEICMERICFCHAYLAFIPFCRLVGAIPCKGLMAEKPRTLFIILSRRNSLCRILREQIYFEAARLFPAVCKPAFGFWRESEDR